MTESKFTCALCNKTFEGIINETWNDSMATKELLDIIPEASDDSTSPVCEYCFKKFKKWYFSLTPEEKRKMHEGK